MKSTILEASALENYEVAKDYTLSFWRANLIALILLPCLVLMTFLPFSLIWGPPNPSDLIGQSRPFVILILVSMPLHEALHAAALLLFGIRLEQMTFGVHWRSLTPYYHCKIPLKASAYRWASLFPFLLLGLLPSAIGIGLHSAFATAYGAIMVGAAAGDLMVVATIRKVASEALVQDHPTRIGCLLLSKKGCT